MFMGCLAYRLGSHTVYEFPFSGHLQTSLGGRYLFFDAERRGTPHFSYLCRMKLKTVFLSFLVFRKEIKKVCYRYSVVVYLSGALFLNRE